jgi:elongation factor 1-beta
MTSIKNVGTDAGLAELNKYLLTRSYIEGFKPSKADVTVLHQLPRAVCSKMFPNVSRWAHHIESFSLSTRVAWCGGCPSKAGAGACTGGAAAKPAAAAAAKKPAADDSDDDFMASLSDDDDDDGAAAAIIAKKAADDAAKKAAKPKVIAKSTLILDVKPAEDTTDLDVVEKLIREITQTGLLWGAAERVPVAYGVKKIRILAVVEDEIVSIDDLQEAIEAIEGVQSTDIEAFNKI